MTYSYERVSTQKQDEKRQEIALDKYNIDKRFIDKKSGKDTDRPALKELLSLLVDGDIIYCESISRLGRNVDDLRQLTDSIKDKGATIHFVKEGISTDGSGYKFLVTILGAVAEMERETINDRIREGMQKAKKYGTKSGKDIGRPEVVLPKNFSKYYDQWQAGGITAVEFAKLLSVGRTTLYRYINIFESKTKQ